jgi:hypothetical protein
MSWSATEIDNETEDDKANDGNDFNGGEPELAFAERPGAQKVDDDYDNASDGDPDGIVDLAVPICGRSQALLVFQVKRAANDWLWRLGRTVDEDGGG